MEKQSKVERRYLYIWSDSWGYVHYARCYEYADGSGNSLPIDEHTFKCLENLGWEVEER